MMTAVERFPAIHCLPAGDQVMRRRSSLLVAALLAVVVSSGWLWFKVVGAGADMTAAGEKFLATLTAEQRKMTLLPYEDPSRVDWYFVPRNQRKGFQVKEMSAEQRKAAHALLSAALSQVGYDKAKTIDRKSTRLNSSHSQ